MTDPKPRVLIAAASARAAAESAANAGFPVTVLDAFDDLDHHASVRVLAAPHDAGTHFSIPDVARAARSIDCDVVVYGSSFENHPVAVTTMAAGRVLWGNAAPVLGRVRDPMFVRRALERRGLPAPLAYFEEPPATTDPGHGWLLKPLASGGGHDIRPWNRSMRIPAGHYVQEFVRGTPGSVAFVAAAGRALPLGLTRQLVGDQHFGGADFTYCGSILSPASDPQFDVEDKLIAAIDTLVRSAALEFGLVGVNGIDFVARDGEPHPVEVNPRWTAAMELIERAYGVSVFGVHASACAAGTRPEFDLERARSSGEAVGKAVVYARKDLTTGDTRPWLQDGGIRDVPRPGQVIRAGRPVCTILATATTAASCYDGLVERAGRIYTELAAWEQTTA